MAFPRCAAIVAILALAGCASSPATQPDFVYALEECPTSIKTCVQLSATYTDKDPAIDRNFDDETRVTEIRRVIVGRLNGSAPRLIELRFRSPEAGLMPDDLGTFAAIGANTILTTHGPLELPAGSLTLIVENSFALIDATDSRARRMAGPELFWKPTWPPEAPGEFWPSFDPNDNLVWISGTGCFQLSTSGPFVALPRTSCRPAILHALTDAEAQPIKDAMDAQGFDASGFAFDVYRIEGMPYYLRFLVDIH